MSNENRIEKTKEKIKRRRNEIDSLNLSLDALAEEKEIVTIYPDDQGEAGYIVFYNKIIVQTGKPKKPI